MKKNVSVKKSTSKHNSDTSQKQASWCSHGCEDDNIADIIQCTKCGKRYHSEFKFLSVRY